MKRGFLLMNTGSPDAPTEEALRSYLKEFLMDPYVIDLPWPLRYALVHWAILPKRPAQSAEAYKSIWLESTGGTPSTVSADSGEAVLPHETGGSPLIHYCTSLADQLNAGFHEPVEPGMAYGKLSFKQAVEKLLRDGVEEICLLPLFPQYAGATVGSCVSGVKRALRGRAKLRVVPPFYLEPSYLLPQAESLKAVDEHILFSYHGLPERQLKKSDPTGGHCLSTPNCCDTASPAHATCYRHQCKETTKAVVKAAGIPDERYSVSFQSRLGRAKWIEPYTDDVLRQFPAHGIKQLAVICPAFFCDCLETLEEIEIRGRDIFMEAGGASFRMIPCLNDSPAGLQCLTTLMEDADNWPITG